MTFLYIYIYQCIFDGAVTSMFLIQTQINSMCFTGESFLQEVLHLLPTFSYFVKNLRFLSRFDIYVSLDYLKA